MRLVIPAEPDGQVGEVDASIALDRQRSLLQAVTAPTTCKALPESESVSYSMQDTQPSTSVPSNASWRRRM